MRRFVTLACALFLAACGGKPDGSPEKLVVGMELEYPPFETVDDSGDPAGVSVDLARALAKDLGRELEIQNYKFNGLTAALARGKVDVVISSMTPTETRKRKVDFSEPYAQTGLALLVQKDSPRGDIESLNQPGVTIAVKTGTTGESFAEEKLPKAKLLKLNHAGACAIEVAQKKADAFIYDQFSVLEFAEKHPTTTALPSPIKSESWAIAIPKGNDELREQVNAFLTKFRADGGFDRLAEKHLKEHKQRFDKAGIPFIF